MSTPPTKTAPPSQRGGTYERDSITRAVLGYGTHTFHDLRPDRKETTIGKGSESDIRIVAPHISGQHCRIERRARGMMLFDEHSHNGTYYETKRYFGLGLKPSFEETRVPADGFHLRPGTTFVVGDQPHRFIAVDDAIRKHHGSLLDILGTEDEVRDAPELVSPCDLILAADSGGHMLITGNPGCGQEELARIVHQISKRRRQRLVERDKLPDDPAEQHALVTDEASKATLVLHLGEHASPLDPHFVTSMFAPSYRIRMIVLARTVAVAREALGAAYVQPMMHIGLRSLADRRAAIHPLLDRWLVAHASPLRVADLTPDNQHALFHHDWRDNLVMLRTTAERLDAIVRAPEFSLNKARKALGVARNTFYSWFGNTLRLSFPLLSEDREPALLAALAAQARASQQRRASDEDAADDLDGE